MEKNVRRAQKEAVGLLLHAQHLAADVAVIKNDLYRNGDNVPTCYLGVCLKMCKDTCKDILDAITEVESLL